MTPPMRAAISADRKRITLKSGPWFEVIPIEKLEDRLEFYTRMSKRPKYGHHYDTDVQCLQRVKERLQGMGVLP